MFTKSERNFFEKIEADIKFDEPMSKHTSFRIGGLADIFAQPDNIKQLASIVKFAYNKKIPYIIIGGGTNILVKDGGINGIVINLNNIKDIRQKQISKEKILITAAAGTKLQKLCTFTRKNSLKGFNFAVGIPGTIGGAITMNAGTSAGCIADIIDNIKILTLNEHIRKIERKNIQFSYRNFSLKNYNNAVIIEASFALEYSPNLKLKSQTAKLLEIRKEKQPSEFSAGSFFKNPESDRPAGKLIDMAGLKGKQIGGARISEKHANFIINTGNAKAKHVIALMRLAQKTVFEKFNIHLEPEVKIVGKE